MDKEVLKQKHKQWREKTKRKLGHTTKNINENNNDKVVEKSYKKV
jgi:hypothetical protein